MEQNQTTTNWTKLDYTLKTAKERADFVANLPKDQLTNKKNLEFLANYIVMAMTPEEKKKKEIVTDNRMITINPMKRLKPIKIPRKVKDYLEDIEFNKLLNAFDLSKFHEYRDYTITKLIFDTGMRVRRVLKY